MDLKEKLQQIVAPICNEQNLHLVEIRVRGDRRNPVFEIFADSEQGITLGQCERLSRSIQDELDMDETFRGNYRLNVSSPGLDHPLKEAWEFKKNLGKMVRINYEQEGQPKEVEGKLKDFSDRLLILEREQETVEVDRQTVTRVKVKIQW